MKQILKLEWVRYVIIGLIGIAIGAIFYPSKTIETEERHKFEQTITKLQAEKETTKTFYQDLYNKEVVENKQYQEESTKKIDSYKEENFKLKQKVSEKRYKIVRPDGTIEEKWFKDSETDVVSSAVTQIKSEFTLKVKSIETKWMKIHEERIKKIKKEHEASIVSLSSTRSETVKKKKVEINKRSFGASFGVMTDEKLFSSITYDVFGPMFLNLHLEADRSFGDKEVGIGIGIRF